MKTTTAMNLSYADRDNIKQCSGARSKRVALRIELNELIESARGTATGLRN